MSNNFYVYLLISSSGTTYVGATVDLDRRLRQHNKELVGGAKATSIKVKKGEIWTRVCYVLNFPSWQAALQFEWRWKRLGRKFQKRMRICFENFQKVSKNCRNFRTFSKRIENF